MQISLSMVKLIHNERVCGISTFNSNTSAGKSQKAVSVNYKNLLYIADTFTKALLNWIGDVVVDWSTLEISGYTTVLA